MIKNILFDLDGTLLDTAPDFKFSLDSVLNQHGLKPRPLSQVRLAVNHGIDSLIELGFGLLSVEEALPFKTQVLAVYGNILGQYALLFQGIESCLNLLDDKAIPWGIVTNKLSKFSQPLVKKFAAFDGSHILISGDTCAHPKPHPAPLLYACEQIKIDPKHTLYVGDAQRDIDAGLSAGMPCMIAHYGYLSPDQNPDLWGAHYHIHSGIDLHRFIQDL